MPSPRDLECFARNIRDATVNPLSDEILHSTTQTVHLTGIRPQGNHGPNGALEDIMIGHFADREARFTSQRSQRRDPAALLLQRAAAIQRQVQVQQNDLHDQPAASVLIMKLGELFGGNAVENRIEPMKFAPFIKAHP